MTGVLDRSNWVTSNYGHFPIVGCAGSKLAFDGEFGI
jgi:hypothetical protein